MDTSSSPKADAVLGVCDYVVEFDEQYPSEIKQKSNVIKYTKLPNFDSDYREWHYHVAIPKQPRIRRVTAIEDADLKSTRSLKPDTAGATTMTMTSYTKRKIVTITEDDENDVYPKLSKDNKRLSSSKAVNKCNKAISTELKEDKNSSFRSTSRLSNISKYSIDAKLNSKVNTNARKETVKKSQLGTHCNVDNAKYQNYRNKDISTHSTKSLSPAISATRNQAKQTCSDKDFSIAKRKSLQNVRTTSTKKPHPRSPASKSPQRSNRNRDAVIISDIKAKNKPPTIIHVPLDNKYKSKKNNETIPCTINPELGNSLHCKSDFSSMVKDRDIFNVFDVNLETEPPPLTVDKDTEMDTDEVLICSKCSNKSNPNNQVSIELFDSLDIPNVTLTKDKNSICKEGLVNMCSKSSPNLSIPTIRVMKRDNNDENKVLPRDSNHCSIIIGRATVTYTTEQKIDFHMVESSDESIHDLSSSPLAYPMNVVSVFKKQLQKQSITNLQKHRKHKENINTLGSGLSFRVSNGMNISNCVDALNNNKLVKPSSIISTMRMDNNLLQSVDICEQFQRELNFIDSFFESLQYLENCSLSNKTFKSYKSDIGPLNTNNLLQLQPTEYCHFLSKLENVENIEESETMASKSLSLLNLLIRDEQRRANNLLFVLKMREDALKDFTKSQILWLENKKKQDNTDISTLKKKQRGALLKLQHECGEMQRMRKALLALSEKRKAALIKTKKNIELKLKNNVDVEQLMLGKKKLKKTAVNDRVVAPVKCFDLISSGCDEGVIQAKSNTTPVSETVDPIKATSVSPISAVICAEKCIQTCDSILETVLVNTGTNTAAENFIVVDGGYLNILFQNLSQPEIFSSGKQYEVNEEALKNILKSVNLQHSLKETDIVEKFMDQFKCNDLDRSSSPSTAHSLVEEMDQYYKGLSSPVESPHCESVTIPSVCDSKEEVVENEAQVDLFEPKIAHSTGTMTIESENTETEYIVSSDYGYVEDIIAKQSMENQTGPLPVPVGAAAETTSVQTPPSWLAGESIELKENSDDSLSSENSSVPPQTTLTSPVHCEAEELRRQQLAIEKEIKALEQQQCHLLVVREIPDKPPPPYTPPTEARTPKPPRMFHADETTEQKIENIISTTDPITLDHEDAFDRYVKDFALEAQEKQKTDLNDVPWDACNLLPHKPELDPGKLVKKITSDLNDVLTGVSPTVVTGVVAGSRRTDHIDDILFAEWRRCEPEWTSLHTDEAYVKNQVFEGIFQKVLSETIDEYKKTVLAVDKQ